MNNAMTNMNKSSRSPQRRGGWNLIELLVVISIISILLAILINAAAEGKAPLEQTKVTMKAAMALATEYEVRTSQIIDHASGTGSTSIQRFINRLWSLSDTQKMLHSLGKDAIPQVGSAPPVAILDGWGREMRYFSGDGVPTETGMVKNKSAYLASAGPDGDWGTINATTNLPNPPSVTNGPGAGDNLYSFNLE